MAKISEIIKKLQRLEEEYGNRELTIYKSFDETTQKINVDSIYFDETIKDIYISIYN